MTHDPTARDPQAIGSVEPADPDIELTTDFLAHSITPEREAEFRRRFAEDERFFAKVAPVISAWRLKASYSDLLARPAESFPLVDAFSLSERKTLRAQIAKTQRRERFMRRWARPLRIAAALVLLIPYPAWFAYRAFKPLAADVGLPAVAGGSALAAAPAVPAGFTLPGATNPNARSGRPSSAGGSPGDTAISTSGAKLWFLNEVGTGYVAPDSAPRLLELKNGGRILLSPGTRIQYGSVTPFLPGSADLYIEGEVALELVDARASALVSVHSAAGYAVVSAGSYAFRCAARCSELAVTVAAGSAELYKDFSGPRGLVVGAGEFGLAPKFDPPVKVPAATAIGFPVVQPAVRRP